MSQLQTKSSNGKGEVLGIQLVSSVIILGQFLRQSARLILFSQRIKLQFESNPKLLGFPLIYSKCAASHSC